MPIEDESLGAPSSRELNEHPPAMTYNIGPSTIQIHVGDLTTSSSQALVSSDDYLLSMGGGVSAAIGRAGGPAIQSDARKMVPRAAGDIVVSGAGDLQARYILHAITIGPWGLNDRVPPGALVRQATQRVMRMLPDLGCTSVAFPAIGAGIAGIPYELVATEMGFALLDSLLDNPDPLKVELYLLDRFRGSGVETFLESFESAALKKFGFDAFTSDEGKSVRNLSQHSPSQGQTDTSSQGRQEQIYSMLRILDQRRNSLESEILDVVANGENFPDGIIDKFNRTLFEINQVRGTYEQELNRSKDVVDGEMNSVFVSSTSRDLERHRAAVRGVIDQLQMTFIGMEDFVPEGTAPAQMIQRKVVESRVYLGILGMRYGFVDDLTGLSMTELEYRQAIASDKDIRVFVMDEDAPITGSMVEKNPQNLQKLNEFRETVLKNHSCSIFQTEHDLAEKVKKTLGS